MTGAVALAGGLYHLLRVPTLPLPAGPALSAPDNDFARKVARDLFVQQEGNHPQLPCLAQQRRA